MTFQHFMGTFCWVIWCKNIEFLSTILNFSVTSQMRKHKGISHIVFACACPTRPVPCLPGQNIISWYCWPFLQFTRKTWILIFSGVSESSLSIAYADSTQVLPSLSLSGFQTLGHLCRSTLSIFATSSAPAFQWSYPGFRSMFADKNDSRECATNLRIVLICQIFMFLCPLCQLSWH